MGIDDLTIGEFKELAATVGGQGRAAPLPFEIGKAYLFCGVTRYFVGRVRSVVGPFVVLDEASWVPSTGRFSAALQSFNLDEVERVPDGWVVNTAALNDAGPWNGALPKETK